MFAQASALAEARQTQQTPDSLCTQVGHICSLGSQTAHRSPLLMFTIASPLPFYCPYFSHDPHYLLALTTCT